MGTWGTALYSCDIADDVRDTCKEIFSFYDIEEGNKKIFSIYTEVIEQDYIDNEYASFWYALADWQWKHGMLTEFIKNKTLELLNIYAGLEEWIDTGNPKDIYKRKSVLNTLKAQLLSPQPPYKKPKMNIVHPKHKPGDIIIFQAPCYKELKNSSIWRIESFTVPLMFESPKFSESNFKDIKGYDAQGKYMAILCVGSVKERHSQYVDNIFDERSVYVWYDYLSVEKPTQDMLRSCGFLPLINWQLKDFNKNITKSLSWTYTFTLTCESFRVNREISEIFKLKDTNEVERYRTLFSQKKYSLDYCGGFCLFSMFSSAFKEKNRAELINEQIDNLLYSNIVNPTLLSPAEVDEAFQKYRWDLI